jgi:putative membrane-bound dehydrogenase-like protein
MISCFVDSKERTHVWLVLALLGAIVSGCGEAGSGPLLAARRPRVATPAPRVEEADESPDEEDETAGVAPVSRDAALPFHVPPGYVAERVAAPPLVRHPMFACFDDRGRLFVAGSSGHNLDADHLSARPPDTIRCLEDSDGDGVFDRSSVFADRLTYPQGVLWHQGAIFTASPPSLWRLEDKDGDGVADDRRELVTGFPFTGIADDLHGPCLGPDGRIYWGVGRFSYAIRKPGGPLICGGSSPLIMRCRPDGEEIEVFSDAMGNPVEVAFSPEGEPFACGTFLSPESQGAGFRDALIHCVQGGIYSVRDREFMTVGNTGDLLPPLAQLGVAAGSGVMIARGDSFGGRGRGQLALYPALFNLRAVPRFVVERDGATFRAREEPFLESSEPDFHPTDVLEDGDGSLLVVDTGGWFRSCPTAQVAKPNVLGAIYRIRRVSAPRVGDPWGRTIDWARLGPRRLVRRLHDRRFPVRQRAVGELARRGDDAIPALREALGGRSSRARLNVVWALARVASPGALDALRGALDDRDSNVRLAAATAFGLHRDPNACDRLKAMLAADAPALRREAATALGRIGRRDAVPALLQALRSGTDRFLEHALVYALIQIGDRDALVQGLSDSSPAVRRGALVALDQMDRSALTLDLVSPHLGADDPALRQAALRVATRRPEWAGALADVLRGWLAGGTASIPPSVLRRQLVAFSKDAQVQAVMAEALERTSTPVATRITILEAMTLAQLDQWPLSWTLALRKVLCDRDEQVVRHAVATVRANDRLAFEGPLLDLVHDPARGRDLRVEATDAVAPRLPQVEASLYHFLVAQLERNEPPLRRLAAARALGRARLDAGQLMALTSEVGTAGALTLSHLLAAYARCRDQRVGAALVEALGHSPGLRSLTPAALEHVLGGFPEEVQHQAEPLARKLDLPDEEKASRLAELANLLGRGDELRGRDVFFGTHAACATCHTVRGEGGHVGPDLSRIGAARTGRDLLESIVFPSASFARGYEPFVVATDDGRVQTGVVVLETGDSIVLATSDRLEIAIPRRSIEAIEPSRVSVMPRGLEANLSDAELADLLAFLQSLK